MSLVFMSLVLMMLDVSHLAPYPGRVMPQETGDYQIIIRKAEITDSDGIAEVHVQSWKATYRGLIPDFILDTLSIERRRTLWENIISVDKTSTLVLQLNGMIAGFVNFGSTRDSDKNPEISAEITAIYLSPYCWRQGLGRKLCEVAIAHIAPLGFQEVTLWVLDGNERAIRFYQHMGFYPDGSKKLDQGKELPLNEVRYVLPLVG
ncbi:MAG: GNAT family N-acetyltransferase [Nostocaceae cyanobacterium]|nr:GNAT family N-acetyltransferase [Nostocaceae cyanobacterium]